MYPTLQFIHILLLVYWLGADLGVYLCARYVGRADLPLAERRRFLELLVQLDMGPRTALVLMIPTGLALALLGGWLPLDPASVAAIGVAALAWLGLVWHLHRSGSMSGALWRIDHYLRHAVVALTLGWGAALLAQWPLTGPRWLGVKLLAYGGAVVLAYCNGGFEDLPATGSERAPDADPALYLDAYSMPWDASVLDPKVSHLRLSRKILRAAADGSCRTYMLAGLPHGRPVDGRVGLETHPHDEEMFLVSGDLSGPQGVMHPGAYFYRPRGIEHGPHFSDLGFLMFMRNPGTNSIQTQWTSALYTLPQEPPYRPVLPAAAPPEWARPFPTRIEY